MDRLKAIVAGVDFSPCSASALKQAIRISRWNQAKLQVIHVIEVLTDLNRPLDQFRQGIVDGLIADAKAAWSQFIASIPEASGIGLEIALGNRTAAMLEKTQQYAADLLVLGTHGTLEPERGTGTLATASVRHAMTKVLLVRDPHAGPFKSIVTCVDFSKTSLRALEAAVRLALQDAAVLHVLHVVQATWPHASQSVGESGIGLEDQHAEIRHRLQEFCGSLCEEMRYLKPEYHVVESPSYGNGIIDFAVRANADLIVLGTQGKTNLRYMLWGSTAERVVRFTPCSVLTVKPE